jgi:hypothetical protein
LLDNLQVLLEEAPPSGRPRPDSSHAEQSHAGQLPAGDPRSEPSGTARRLAADGPDPALSPEVTPCVER